VLRAIAIALAALALSVVLFTWHSKVEAERAQARADQQFSLLKANPQHPSLQFKRVGRAPWPGSMVCPRHIELPRPAMKRADGFLWFWNGDHKACEALIS